MMRQYWAIKNRYPGTLLLFRLGDFYETFGEDAVKTARTLGITLTSRGKEAGSPIPLAGIPFHSVEPYIDRLVAAGFKVAIAHINEHGEVDRLDVSLGVMTYSLYKRPIQQGVRFKVMTILGGIAGMLLFGIAGRLLKKKFSKQ